MKLYIMSLKEIDKELSEAELSYDNWGRISLYDDEKGESDAKNQLGDDIKYLKGLRKYALRIKELEDRIETLEKE